MPHRKSSSTDMCIFALCSQLELQSNKVDKHYFIKFDEAKELFDKKTVHRIKIEISFRQIRFKHKCGCRDP